ncbi:MAG: SCO family protein [Gammaproteobacteria bacterium]|nr:SCO family protein [Gammaproteobacteria bacterium]
MMSQRNRGLYRGVILLVLLLSVTGVWYVSMSPSSPPPELVGVLRPAPKILKPVKLIDQNGAVSITRLFKDKWSFVFFGYTSCPDICPTTLHVLNTVTDMLGKDNAELLPDTQVVFISVDPMRDTVADLADYVKFFNRDFVGLTGDQKNIDNITQQFGAGYILEEETAPGQYMVAHTSAVFLVTPELGLVAAFSQPHNPKTIVAQYKKIRAYLSE